MNRWRTISFDISMANALTERYYNLINIKHIMHVFRTKEFAPRPAIETLFIIKVNK